MMYRNETWDCEMCTCETSGLKISFLSAMRVRTQSSYMEQLLRKKTDDVAR